MKEQTIDQSIISSKCNDLSTAINDNSTIINQKSNLSIQPIHCLSETYLSPIKYKKFIKKPAFGTSSNRQIKQLNGNKLTDVVAYSRIFYDKNQKYHDRYQQIQPKITPFLTTSPRFSNFKKTNPGPGTYKFPQIFENQPDSIKNKTPMYCPFKKWQGKQRKDTEKNDQIVKSQIYSQEKQNLQRNNNELQQRIKRKREEMRQKMFKLKQMMRKPKSEPKIDFTRMGYNPNKQNTTDEQKNQNQVMVQDKKQFINQPDLKEITKKYLPKMQFEFQRQSYRTGSDIKNYREKYNNHPVFLSQNQKLFSSYIDYNQNPGPGYYEKRTKKLAKHKKQSLKKLFL